jgi:hypothetical protein
MSIELQNLYNIDFIDSGRSELLLDSLISNAINTSIESFFFLSQKTY